jgi:hypothetical protein
MTDTYNDTTGSRKKFLIPLVVLLLCAVSLTGAGYAYNASVTVPDNHVVSEDLYIDLATPASTDVNIKDADCVYFADNYVYTFSPSLSKTNTVKAFAEDGKITYNLKITGEAASASLKISSEDIATYLAGSVGLGSAVKVNQLISFRVNVVDDIQTSKVFDGTSDIVFNVAKAAKAEQPVTVYLFVVSETDTGVPVQTGAYDANKTATDFVAAFNALKFKMTFTADSEAAPTSYGAAEGHAYSVADPATDVVWDLSDIDAPTCTITFTCANCDDEDELVLSGSNVHFEEVTPATCDAEGAGIFWVSGVQNGLNYAFTKEYVIPQITAAP